MHPHLTLPLLVLLLLLSLTLKSIGPEPLPADVAREINRQQLFEHLSTVGIRSSGSQALTSRGEFELLAFEPQQCPGALYLMPLYRNAEGHKLLATRLQQTPRNEGFIYRGQRYPQFPSLAYWWFEHSGRLLGATKATPVLHFFEYGPCQMASHLSAF